MESSLLPELWRLIFAQARKTGDPRTRIRLRRVHRQAYEDDREFHAPSAVELGVDEYMRTCPWSSEVFVPRPAAPPKEETMLGQWKLSLDFSQMDLISEYDAGWLLCCRLVFGTCSNRMETLDGHITISPKPLRHKVYASTLSIGICYNLSSGLKIFTLECRMTQNVSK